MKREFKFAYLGTRTTGEHQGRVLNLQLMKTRNTRLPPPGMMSRNFVASTKPELWSQIISYVKNYPGNHPATLLVNGIIHQIPGAHDE